MKIPNQNTETLYFTKNFLTKLNKVHADATQVMDGIAAMLDNSKLVNSSPVAKKSSPRL